MDQSAVALTVIEPGVALVTMQDRVNKNTFSREIVSGLFEAFARIEKDQEIRVVILTGYDSYFSAGGTQESLMAMQEGRSDFINEYSGKYLYSLPLECPVPVIAAMQGHGIGGGFVLGLFSDMIILGRESLYTTNFMKYGFTPGFGSTCIVPAKLGVALAEEMLLSAHHYRGAELEKRSSAWEVVPREQVLPRAIERARELAEKPRLSLVTLKNHLVAKLRSSLPDIIAKELVMHDITFHQNEVKERIEQLFGK